MCFSWVKTEAWQPEPFQRFRQVCGKPLKRFYASRHPHTQLKHIRVNLI